jgi:hypothetical protein
VLRFAADHNFNELILLGLLRQRPNLDVIRARDSDLAQAHDRRILEWAADERRVLLTQDARTLPRFACERIAGGLCMPGVIEVRRRLPVGVAIEEILLIGECMDAGEIEGRILYVPL